MLPHADLPGDFEGPGRHDPNLMICFVANVKRSGAGFDGQTRQEYDGCVTIQPHGFFQFRLASSIFEYVEHAFGTPTHVKPPAVRAKRATVKGFWQRDKLGLVFGVQADEIDADFVKPGADRDDRFAVRRDQHFQGQVANRDVLASGGKAQTVEEQIGIGRQVLALADRRAINIFGRQSCRGLLRLNGQGENTSGQEERQCAKITSHRPKDADGAASVTRRVTKFSLNHCRRRRKESLIDRSPRYPWLIQKALI